MIIILKTTYGEKLYKISLNAGMTCPNRDALLGTSGCIFCSSGSGDFTSTSTLSITKQKQSLHLFTTEQYFNILWTCISFLRPDIVIHRLAGDGPRSILIHPAWSGNKRHVLNQMHAFLKANDIWQGKELQLWQNHLPYTN